METLKDKIFKIVGAGEIRISESAEWECGDAKGFSIDTKFTGQNYFSGGVISAEDARELANHILSTLAAND